VRARRRRRPGDLRPGVGFASLRITPQGAAALRVRPALPGVRALRRLRQSAGRTVLGNRLVARFERSRSFVWSGRGRRAATG
jgi:hypothetical protein